MGGFAPLAAENVGAFANPLVSALTALGNFPMMRLQMEQAKLQTQYLPRQMEAQLQEQQGYADEMKSLAQQRARETAQTDWQQIGQIALANPQWAKSPQLIQRATETAQTLGIPPPLKPDGSIDTDVWKTSWFDATSKDKTLNDEALSRPAGPQRDAFLATYSGVPDAVRYGAQSLNPRDQAQIMRSQSLLENAGSLGKYRDAMTQAVSKRLQIQQELANGTLQLDQARYMNYIADANKANADASTALIRAQTAQTNANTRQQELDLSLRKFDQQTTYQNQTMLRQSAQASINEMKGLDGQIDSLSNQIVLATEANADPTRLKQLNDQLYLLKTRRDHLQNSVTRANAVLDVSISSGAAAAQHAKSGSGARDVKATPVGPAKTAQTPSRAAQGGFVIGKTYPDGSGHTAKYIGGDPKDINSWQTP